MVCIYKYSSRQKYCKNVPVQITTGVIGRDIATDFTQVAIMETVTELPKVLRSNIIEQHSNGKSYRAMASYCKRESKRVQRHFEEWVI